MTRDNTFDQRTLPVIKIHYGYNHITPNNMTGGAIISEEKTGNKILLLTDHKTLITDKGFSEENLAPWPWRVGSEKRG